MNDDEKNIQEEAERISRELDGLYHQVFSTEQGQQVLRDLMKYVELGDFTFFDDSRRFEYAYGQKSIVMHILNRMGRQIHENPLQHVDDLYAGARRYRVNGAPSRSHDPLATI